jgi:phenylalanyl-tRNA synthetase beta chain
MDGKHTLTTQDIVIADEEKVLALAGVIGGASSAITQSTTRIIVELANFDPIMVRKTAIRHSSRTDASSRYEKNISPLMTQSMIIALRDSMTYYQKDLGDLERKGITPHQILPLHLAKVPRHEQSIQLTVSDFTTQQVDDVLTHLGIQTEEKNVIIPRRRSPKDLVTPADVSEEVVRIIGYDQVAPQEITQTLTHAPLTDEVQLQRHIETILTHQYGCDSVETYPRADDEILAQFGVEVESLSQLQNALQPEQSHLSHSLLYNLLRLVTKNSKFFDNLHYYTIGSVRNGSPTAYADTR